MVYLHYRIDNILFYGWMFHCMNIVQVYSSADSYLDAFHSWILQIMLLLTFMYNSRDQTYICILIKCLPRTWSHRDQGLNCEVDCQCLTVAVPSHTSHFHSLHTLGSPVVCLKTNKPASYRWSVSRCILLSTVIFLHSFAFSSKAMRVSMFSRVCFHLRVFFGVNVYSNYLPSF